MALFALADMTYLWLNYYWNGPTAVAGSACDGGNVWQTQKVRYPPDDPGSEERHNAGNGNWCCRY